MEALKDISKFDKEQLEIYARGEFKVELNKRKKLADLRAEVVSLQKGETPLVSTASEEKKEPRYLRHPVTRRVFVSTPDLLDRKDMIPCDIDGNNA